MYSTIGIAQRPFINQGCARERNTMKVSRSFTAVGLTVLLVSTSLMLTIIAEGGDDITIKNSTHKRSSIIKTFLQKGQRSRNE